MEGNKVTAKRISPEEHQQIVDMKLDCVPVADIAAEVGCTRNTVTEHWHQWLDETTEERREHLERKRSEILGRLQSVASIARRSVRSTITDPDMDADQTAKAVARFLTEERQALKEMSRIAGWDAPTKVVTSFQSELPSDEEAARILAELDELDACDD